MSVWGACVGFRMVSERIGINQIDVVGKEIKVEVGVDRPHHFERPGVGD